MKSKNMVYVVLKLFAIYLITKGIEYLSDGILFWSAYLTQKTASVVVESTPAMIPQTLFLLNFFTAAFLFSMASITWIFTTKIVKYILPIDNKVQKENNRQIKAKDLQTAAFTFVGIVIFSQTILYLSNWIRFLIMKTTEAKIKKVMILPDAVHFLTITGILIYLIIGIVLIVWGKQFSEFISKINPGAVTLAQWLRLLPKTKKSGKTGVEDIQAV